jgi:hypothetical protein
LSGIRLEDRLREVMAAEQVPGLAFAVVQNQEIVHAQGVGVTSTEPGGCAVTPETLFRIGSVPKALTGTAILRLADAGKLELDAPVTKYIPWLELSEPGAAQQKAFSIQAPSGGAEVMNHGTPAPHWSDVIQRLILILRRSYVLPDKCDAIEERLQSGLASGYYAMYDDGPRLAERLTADLQSVTRDRHLQVWFHDDPSGEGTAEESRQFERKGRSAWH